MMAYERVQLGSVATIRGGKRLPAGADFTTSETAHPYIRARDIGGGKVEIHDAVFLEDATARKLSRYTTHKGDICLTIVGANVGEMGVVPPHLDGANLTENAVKIVTNGKVEQTFLKYALLSDDALGQMKVLAGGAAQPKLGIYKIETIEFPLPSLPIQRRIAGILSAYDELIENSQRRIKILETMARTLYREWFVHFRFPGHEKIPLVASSLGDIPQGWQVKPLGELTAYLNRGLSPSYDDNGDSVVINQKCIRNQQLSLEASRRQSKPIPPDKLVRFGDVLINSTGVGTLGRVAQVYQGLDKCTVDTHVTIARPNPETDIDYFGCTLLNHQETFERLGLGATGQTELSRASIASVDLVVPPDPLQSRFGEVVRPMRVASMSLVNQIQNLRRTRDLLLPRLLSGQVSLNINESEQQLASAEAESSQPTPAPVISIPTPRKPANESAQSAKVADVAPPTYAADKPPDINDTERIDVLCAIRALFSDGVARDRATAIRDLAHALGYQRTGSRIQEVLATDLLTAVRRGTVVNEGGEYSLGFRSLAECTRDSMKNDFEFAIGRGWTSRDDAIRAFARWLGFARVGKVIDDTARSLINGLIREGRLETDGSGCIRKAR